jgi:hypothetical protein
MINRMAGPTHDWFVQSVLFWSMKKGARVAEVELENEDVDVGEEVDLE